MHYYPELRVKIKTLTAEAGIIRHEVAKARNPLRAAYMTEHRRGELRYEARHSQLAYGFLRGRQYAELEYLAAEEPNWKKIAKTVARFEDIASQFDGSVGSTALYNEWMTWMSDAQEVWQAGQGDRQVRHAARLQARAARREYLKTVEPEVLAKELAEKRAAWEAKQVAAEQQPEPAAAN